jgi:holo-[acyl-carrier protein] synthase
MIFGVGIDMIEVERVAHRISSQTGFREKVFSKSEIAYCEAQGDRSAQHYAARFCAKEAFLKATGQGMNLTFELNQIEVRQKEGGMPELHLLAELGRLQKQNQWDIHVSLTHLAATAAAVVVIEILESQRGSR